MSLRNYVKFISIQGDKLKINPLFSSNVNIKKNVYVQHFSTNSFS